MTFFCISRGDFSFYFLTFLPQLFLSFPFFVLFSCYLNFTMLLTCLLVVLNFLSVSFISCYSFLIRTFYVILCYQHHLFQDLGFCFTIFCNVGLARLTMEAATTTHRNLEKSNIKYYSVQRIF